MTSHNLSSPIDSADSEWQTLVAFTASRESDDLYAPIESIAAAAQGLNVARSQLEQIKNAVSGAVRNVLDHRQRLLHEHAVRIRILVANNTTRATQCWGFFLLERIADDAHNLANGIGYLIEVFLYPD